MLSATREKGVQRGGWWWVSTTIDRNVEEAFEGYCSVFQRETGSFKYLYLYKHLDHKHLKHHR